MTKFAGGMLEETSANAVGDSTFEGRAKEPLDSGKFLKSFQCCVKLWGFTTSHLLLHYLVKLTGEAVVVIGADTIRNYSLSSRALSRLSLDRVIPLYLLFQRQPLGESEISAPPNTLLFS